MTIKTDKVVDAKGLSCPMPIVKTKKGMDELKPGQVLEIDATDKGSLADLKAWAKGIGHQYLGTQEEDGVLKHFIRKASADEIKPEAKFPHSISNTELEEKLNTEGVKILDVREPAEHAFNRVPGAISIPIGEFEERLEELDRDDEIYVICRSGSRSDRASQILADKGFKNVKNVLPGMCEWSGPTERSH